MTTLREVKIQIEKYPKHWSIYLLDFVDEFRRSKNPAMIQASFKGPSNRWAALLASTAEFLCQELGMEVPEWIEKVPAVKDPWFVAGLNNLKAIALVESPLAFRHRKIFVMENFLFRV